MSYTHLTPVLALLFYFIAAGFSGSTSDKQIVFVRASVSLGILFHLFSLFIFYPIASTHLLAISMSVASLVLGIYFIISGGGRFKSLRQLVLGFLILLYLCSSGLLHLGHPDNSMVKSAYLLWSHVCLSLIGLLNFLVAGCLSFAYLSQAKALRPKKNPNGARQEQLSKVLGRLPSLRELSRLIKLSGKIGLFSTIIGLYLGLLYTESTGVRINFLEPKLLLPTILVIYYGLILVFRSRISETMFAKLSSVGVILTISSLLVASLK